MPDLTSCGQPLYALVVDKSHDDSTISGIVKMHVNEPYHIPFDCCQVWSFLQNTESALNNNKRTALMECGWSAAPLAKRVCCKAE